MNGNRRDGQETRKRLLEAAIAAFAEKGFHHAKTAEICNMANANVAAVNYHFGTKENLYIEAWRHAFERSIELYPPGSNVPLTAPAEERLRGHVLSTIRRIMDPESMDFDIVHHEMGHPTGLLAEVMRRSLEPLHQQFAAVVHELLGENASEQQVELCVMSIHAQCFWPLIHERNSARMPDGEKPPGPTIEDIGIETMVDHIMNFSLGGLGRIKDNHKYCNRVRASGDV